MTAEHSSRSPRSTASSDVKLSPLDRQIDDGSVKSQAPLSSRRSVMAFDLPRAAEEPQPLHDGEPTKPERPSPRLTRAMAPVIGVQPMPQQGETSGLNPPPSAPDDVDQWAGKQIVSTVDDVWKQWGDDLDQDPSLWVARPAEKAAPKAKTNGDVNKYAARGEDNPSATVDDRVRANIPGIGETSTHSEADSADAAPHDETALPVEIKAVIDGYRQISEGNVKAATVASTGREVWAAVVEQTQALLDGMDLKGELTLGTQSATVDLDLPSIGKVSASVAVEGGVVDLTIATQAAAAMGEQLDSLRSLMQDAGLQVGELKTVPMAQEGAPVANGEMPGQHFSGQDSTPKRSGSVLASPQEERTRGEETSQGRVPTERRQAHLGQVRVTA